MIPNLSKQEAYCVIPLGNVLLLMICNMQAQTII